MIYKGLYRLRDFKLILRNKLKKVPFFLTKRDIFWIKKSYFYPKIKIIRMKTLTIRPSKGVSLDKAKLALENLNFEIITNTKDSVQVSPEVLNMIDEALEEEKKGIFISNEAVLQDAREFIQKTAI